MRPGKMTEGFLDAFAEAFNRHDVEAILAAMTENCVFEASGGPDVCGRRYEGPREVGKAFAEVLRRSLMRSRGAPGTSLSGIGGSRNGRSVGTRADGTRVEVTGCDIFTFRDGKIAVKNSYRKQRT